jgi:hypothetical protein
LNCSISPIYFTPFSLHASLPPIAEPDGFSVQQIKIAFFAEICVVSFDIECLVFIDYSTTMVTNNFDLSRQIRGLHAKDGDVDTEEPVTEFKAKLNKYGFLHVPKKAVPSLPFEPEKPLIARIEGETLVIASSPEKPT